MIFYKKLLARKVGRYVIIYEEKGNDYTLVELIGNKYRVLANFLNLNQKVIEKFVRTFCECPKLKR